MIWYAVLIDEDDNDWGTGSFDYCEAVKMAKEYENGRVAVIHTGSNPICTKVIKKEEF